MSWLKLWDEVVFGRPIALRGRPGGGTSTKGARSNDESTGAKKPPGRKFEKRMEYQDPTAFSGFEVDVVHLGAYSTTFVSDLYFHLGTG